MAKLSSEFLDYLASHQNRVNSQNSNGWETCGLPSLQELSRELGLSVSSLREQLEVAKALGLVEIKPRTGIRRLPYSFSPAVQQSLTYAIATDWNHFLTYSDLRNHIETAYWDEAARKLTADDRLILRLLISRAWEKLSGQPVQIPHQEHRQLHLQIFSRLDNPFVMGLLEAFWNAYESVGLNLYADYDYLRQVWTYHQVMVEAIEAENYEKGFKALVLHRDLLSHRPNPAASNSDLSIQNTLRARFE